MSRGNITSAAWKAQRRRVLERDEWTCGYCGVELVDKVNATVDHIDPIADNPGKFYADNELVAACHDCNSRKQDSLSFRVPYINDRFL